MNNRMNGFSLVETMVAVGVLSIASLAMIFMYSQQMKNSNMNDFRAARTQLNLNMLGQFLNDPNNCKCLFSGVSDFATPGPSTLTGATPTAIGTYHFLSPGVCATATVPAPLVDSVGVNGLILKSTQLTNIKMINPGVYQGDLNLTVATPKEVLGPSSLNLTFHVAVQATASGAGTATFNGCSSAASSAGGPLIYERTCFNDNADKSAVYSTIPAGVAPCTPTACKTGDADLGMAGCQSFSAGKYHSTFQCMRECAAGGPAPSGQYYKRYCGFWLGGGPYNGDTACTATPCLAGDTVVVQSCQQNGSGYSGQLIGSCTATCKVH